VTGRLRRFDPFLDVPAAAAHPAARHSETPNVIRSPRESRESRDSAHACRATAAPRLMQAGLLALLAGLTACSSIENLAAGDKVDYRSSGSKTGGLEVPPDLTQLARDSRYQQPGGPVSATTYQAAGTAAPLATNVVAPNNVANMRIERQGTQRWLVTPLTPEQVWPQLQAFWKERGFTLITDQADAGVMETEWAENRAKLPKDVIRSTLGPLVDFLYSTGERDKFRTRVERSAAGTEIYITHKGLSEEYANDRKDSTVWQARPSDPQLEAEMLQRLIVKLGAKEEQAKTIVANGAAPAAGRRRLRPRVAPSRPGTGPQRLHRRGPRPCAGAVLRALCRSGAGRQGRAGLLRQAVQLRQVREPDRPDPLPGGCEDRGRAQRGVGVDRTGCARKRRCGQTHRQPAARRPALSVSTLQAPRLRFRSLGSGSGGNATLVEGHAGGGSARLLIDCGFTLREAQSRLEAVGCAPGELDAVFITHEHGDHIGCALALNRRFGVPLWMSTGTWRAIGAPPLPADTMRRVRDGEALRLGPLLLRPFTVPHDAAEPLQLRVECAGLSLGVLTDVGTSTEHVLEHLAGCHALLLECNHDRHLLQASRYPPSLKSRIAGRLGHLSNEAAAAILAASIHPGLVHIVAAHLSEQNNDPALARAALQGACGGHEAALHVACQRQGSDWIELG